MGSLIKLLGKLSLIKARNNTKCLSSLAIYHDRINLNIKPKYEDCRTGEGARISGDTGQLWNHLPLGFVTSMAKDREKVCFLNHWPRQGIFVYERHALSFMVIPVVGFPVVSYGHGFLQCITFF